MLAPLEPLDADPGGAERGQIIHAVLERVRAALAGASARRSASRAARDRARATSPLRPHRPQVWAVWWPRFERIAAWFCASRAAATAGACARILTEIRGALELRRARRHVPHPRARRPDRDRPRRPARHRRLQDRPAARAAARSPAGLSPQLAIEALIAESGGFERMRRRPRPALLLFLQLKGGEPLAGERAGSGRRDGDLRAAARPRRAAGVARLVAHFDDPATAYVPVPRPEIAPSRSATTTIWPASASGWGRRRRRERMRAPTPAQRARRATRAARSGSPPMPAPARPAC